MFRQLIYFIPYTIVYSSKFSIYKTNCIVNSTRNGESMGIAFDKVTHGLGVAYFPAVSLAMQEHLYANFGHVPFM